MRKGLKYIWGICLPLLFAGCFDDQGNYSYTKIPDIEVEGIDVEKGYRYNRLDMLNIPVTVKTAYDEADLAYTWSIYGGSGETAVDTVISREKNLDYCIKEAEGDYALVLKVQYTGNQYAVYTSAKLQVETAFSRGLYVLKNTADGNTELDFCSQDTVVTHNLLEGTLGHSLAGRAQVLAQMLNYPYIDPATNRKTAGAALGITTEKDVCLLLAKDMSLIHDGSTLFFGEERTGKPGRFFRSMTCECYLSEEGVYAIDAYSLMDEYEIGLGSGCFSFPSTIAGGSKWLASDGTNFMYWDEVNRRFLRVNYNGEVSDFKDENAMYKPNHMDGELLYMGACHYNENEKCYAVFETASGRMLYQMELTTGSNPIDQQETYTVDAALKFNRATCYAVCAYSAPVLFYVADGALYSYAFETRTETPVTLEGLPVGETINFVSDRFWGGYGDSRYHFNYLVVGTTNGSGNYTLSFYEMVGGVPQTKPAIQFSGTGEVVDVQYMAPVSASMFEWNKWSYTLSY